MPVIFPDQITHSSINIGEDEVELYSAGFCHIDEHSFVWVDENKVSESTGKGPKKEDQNLLQNAVWNSGTSAFVDYEYNPFEE